MKVIITPRAQKDFSKLPPTERKKIQRHLLVLASDPFIGKKLEGELQDQRSLRAWPYRILYSVKQREKEVWVASILHRQGAYK